MSTSSHPHHVLPLKLYLSVGATLLVLTVATVAVAQVHLGPFNLVIALAIAVLKASLVALFFMHLAYDNRLFMLTFLVAVVFLGVFIIFTMFDTLRRGDINPETAFPLRRQAALYDTLHTAPEHPASGLKP